jgi:hypothetical protein
MFRNEERRPDPFWPRHVAILGEAFEATGGKLDAALEWIRGRRYLSAASPPPVEIAYAGYTFAVEWD